MKKKYNILILLVSVLFLGTSCEDFLNINEDPNNPLEVPLSQLLPSTELSIFREFGSARGDLGNMASLYVGQITERGTEFNDYGINGQTFTVSGPWGGIYINSLTNIRELIAIGTEQENWHYVGIAKILKAYSYSVLVDFYGDVPFDNANLGSENLNPTYELGENIYPQLFNMLDSGVLDLKKSSLLSPGSDDVIYYGDLDKWEKFANTLKLKLLNQIRLTRDVSTDVNAILANDPVFESIDDDFQLQYGTSASPDARNPYYASEWGPAANSQYINPYFYEIMTGQNTFHRNDLFLGIDDPRVPYYFYNQLAVGEDPENPSSYWETSTGFLSIYQFSFNIDPNEGFDQSSSVTLPGLYACGGRYDDGSGINANFNGSGDVPQRLLTYADLQFILAELSQEGVIADNPVARYQAGIQASFDKLNDFASTAGAPTIPQADIDTYIASIDGVYTGASAAGQLEVIMTQKWIANFSNGIESYNDYRRTGYPLLHDGNDDDLAITVQTRQYPVAFPWSLGDLNINNQSPAQKNITTATVFWDL